MKVAGRAMRTIWLAADGQTVEIIDQTRLPHELVIARLTRLDDAARAIRDMQVRGAPLIGATAAYGVALAMLADPSDQGIDHAVETLAASTYHMHFGGLPSGLPRRSNGPVRLPRRMSRSIAPSASTVCR